MVIRKWHSKKGEGKTLRQTFLAEYEIWKSAKQRCLNPRQARYADYGGRGITMCDRWRYSFANFIADMGPRPTGPERFTVERMNNDGPYSPENCKWGTYTEQANNARKSGLVHVLAAGKSPDTHKYCCTCKGVLPKENFKATSYVSPRRRTNDGLRPQCHQCRLGHGVPVAPRRGRPPHRVVVYSGAAVSAIEPSPELAARQAAMKARIARRQQGITQPAA